MEEDIIFAIKQREYGISPFPDDTVEAMAYIPYQNANITYNPERGLCSGTLFPCLDKPFHGCCGGNKK